MLLVTPLCCVHSKAVSFGFEALNTGCLDGIPFNVWVGDEGGGHMHVPCICAMVQLNKPQRHPGQDCSAGQQDVLCMLRSCTHVPAKTCAERSGGSVWLKHAAADRVFQIGQGADPW